MVEIKSFLETKTKQKIGDIAKASLPSLPHVYQAKGISMSGRVPNNDLNEPLAKVLSVIPAKRESRGASTFLGRGLNQKETP